MSTLDNLLGIDPAPASEFAVTKSDKPDPPYVRGDRFDTEQWSDPKNLIRFMNNMRTVPLDAVDSEIVNRSYPAMLWQFRKAAIQGDLKATSALEKWLTWAKPIAMRKAEPKEIPESRGSVAFLAREPSKDESE